MWWRGAALLAGGAAALSLAACSSPSPAPTAGTTSAPSSPPASPGTTTTSSVPAGVPCAARTVMAAVVGSQGAAGTIELTFGLHNTSTTACPMEGYPGAQLLGAEGAELPTHVVSGGNFQFTDFAPAAVTLAPGATAYFNLAYSDVPSGTETSCPTATQIEVTPPHASDHDVVTVQIMACAAGTLTVSPVFSATSPQSQTTAPSSP